MLLELDSMATHPSSRGKKRELSYYMPGWLNYFSPDLGRRGSQPRADPRVGGAISCPMELGFIYYLKTGNISNLAHHRPQGWAGYESR